MRSKGTTKAQGLLLIKRKQSNGCWGEWGADQALQPYTTNWRRALGTHGFGAVCSGLRWSSRVGFCCRAPPLWDPTHCHHAKLGNPTRNPHRRSRIHSPAMLAMAVGRLPSSDALLLLLLLFRTAVLRPRCKNINQLQQPTGPSTASPALDELLLLFCRSAGREEWRNAKRNGILTFLLRLAPDSTAGGAHSQQGSPAAREQTELFNICPSRPSSQQLHWKSWV